MKALIESKKIIKFGPRVRDIDKQYEINNNADMDNGQFHQCAADGAEEGGGGQEQQNEQQDDATDEIKPFDADPNDPREPSHRNPEGVIDRAGGNAGEAAAAELDEEEKEILNELKK